MAAVTRKIDERRALGRRFSIIVTAEGAHERGAAQRVVAGTEPGKDKVRLGGIGEHVARDVQARTGVEARAVVLGHLQRGGNPAPLDRVLASAFGVHAVDMASRGLWGRMAALRYPTSSTWRCPRRSAPTTSSTCRARCAAPPAAWASAWANPPEPAVHAAPLARVPAPAHPLPLGPAAATSR